MSKKIILILSFVISISIYASVTVEYHNKDSKSYTFDVKCSGSSYKVVFDSSKTSTTTIQGSAPCIVETSHGKVELKGGEKIELKDGKILIK